MSDLPKEALAPADAPWPSNPAFTRKEAGEAKQAGPMTPELAELALEACQSGVPLEEALRRLGYSPAAAKRAVNHEFIRMVLLRQVEEAGGTDQLAAQVLVDGLKAEYVEVAKCEGEITDEKAFADHPTRLNAFDRLMELKGLGGRRTRREGSDESDSRPILNVQAGANVQVIYFGEAKDAPDGPGHPE